MGSSQNITIHDRLWSRIALLFLSVAYPLRGFAIHYTSNSVKRSSFFIPSLSFNLQPERLPETRWSESPARGEKSTDIKKVSIT